jgi:DNA-binding Lrp family transcriptional regulator
LTKISLDAFDMKILSEIQRDGRLSNKDLSERVNLSASPCLVRLRRLERSGVIQRYSAIIDLKKITESIKVVCELYLHESNIKASKLVESYIKSLPQTVSFFDVNGACDYIVQLECRGTDDYYAIARRLLEEEAFHVRQLTSFIVLREIVERRGFDLQYLTADTAKQASGD